jgi:hypothetical protein
LVAFLIDGRYKDVLAIARGARFISTKQLYQTSYIGIEKPEIF